MMKNHTKNKQYTPIRRFYAVTGFLTLLAVVSIGVGGIFIGSTTHYSIQEVSALEGEISPPKELQIWVESDAEISAYTSDPAETDDTPFITASGRHVAPWTVANNCLPFGTIVMIDGSEFEVIDRMNSRYGCDHYDIWFNEKQVALDFGRQIMKVAIRYETN